MSPAWSPFGKYRPLAKAIADLFNEATRVGDSVGTFFQDFGRNLFLSSGKVPPTQLTFCGAECNDPG